MMGSSSRRGSSSSEGRGERAAGRRGSSRARGREVKMTRE